MAKSSSYCWLAAVVAVLATTSPVRAAPPTRLSTAVLAEQPFIRLPKLSPDGTHVAAWLSVNGKEALGVIGVDSKDIKTLASGEKYDINWFRWAGNDTVLVSIGQTIPYLDGEAWMTRLIAYDFKTGAGRFIGGKREGLIGDDVLWVDPAGKSVLLAFQRTIYDYPSVSRVELATNTVKEVVPPRENVWDWYADNDGIVRAGLGYLGTRWFMRYRATEAEAWRTVVRAAGDNDDAGFDAFRIFAGSDAGYRIMLNEATGRYALYNFDYAKRERGALVFESPTNDIDDFDTGDTDNTLLFASFTEETPKVRWFDPAMGKLQNALDKALPGTHPRVVSRSRDDSVVLVRIGNASDPGAYYLYRAQGRQLSPFAEVNAKLDPATLAATRYVSFKARDGLDIPAYLTLPPGREAAKGLPLIVMPHGGPYDVRDEGGYDPEVQFLANRGYAVLQPQFRGSGGYGKPFYEKGAGQWGRAMQDDLDDGMDWLARQGTIDSKRVCLIGGSYGGYAALWGAVRNPERYRCAASFAGVSDLRRQLKFQITFKVSKRYSKDWRRIVKGDDGFDLRTVSPLYAADRLKVPVLLMHGDLDQRVPFAQSKLLADKLKQAGKDYEFYPLKGEGHGFSTSANQQQWLDRLDAFLAKHNPAA